MQRSANKRRWEAAGTLAILLLLAAGPTSSTAQTNEATATNTPPQITKASAEGQRSERVRSACVEGRRHICGRVLQILPEGLVVDSGYSALLQPPFTESWVVAGNVTVSRDTNAIELKVPATMCVGTIFLTDLPRKPKPKQYDYVILTGYPCGEYTYSPVPKVEKTVRRFAGGLDTAVRLNLAAGEK
jgi:hypothetical protein